MSKVFCKGKVLHKAFNRGDLCSLYAVKDGWCRTHHPDARCDSFINQVLGAQKQLKEREKELKDFLLEHPEYQSKVDSLLGPTK